MQIIRDTSIKNSFRIHFHTRMQRNSRPVVYKNISCHGPIADKNLDWCQISDSRGFNKQGERGRSGLQRAALFIISIQQI
jgi:hypothetical protein